MSSPPGDQRRVATLWAATLKTFQHVTDEEDRTQNALKFVPWIFATIFLILASACVLAALITGHTHMGVIAKSTAVRWAAGLVAGSTASTVAIVRARRRLRRRAAQSVSAAPLDQCRCERAKPLGLPGGEQGQGQRNDRPDS